MPHPRVVMREVTVAEVRRFVVYECSACHHKEEFEMPSGHQAINPWMPPAGWGVDGRRTAGTEEVDYFCPSDAPKQRFTLNSFITARHTLPTKR